MLVRSTSLGVLVLGCALAFASCGSDSDSDSNSVGVRADDDDDSSHDDSDDDAADDDAADDDAADDDDADDDEVVTTFEGPDGGTFEIVFSGEGVECGDEQCLDAMLGDFGFMGCCADEAESQCGLDLAGIGVLLGLLTPGCEPLGLPGSEDPDCEDSPPLEAALPEVNGQSLPGCCQASGQCGFSASIEGIGFGCVAPERFGFDEGADCEYTEQ